jgi:hypothetical protein
MENEENKIEVIESENGVGGIIGAIIIIVVILIGGWYFIVNRNERIEQTDEVIETPISESTEIIDIEADLESLNLDALDKELDLE